MNKSEHIVIQSAINILAVKTGSSGHKIIDLLTGYLFTVDEAAALKKDWGKSKNLSSCWSIQEETKYLKRNGGNPTCDPTDCSALGISSVAELEKREAAMAAGWARSADESDSLKDAWERLIATLDDRWMPINPVEFKAICKQMTKILDEGKLPIHAEELPIHAEELRLMSKNRSTIYE